MEQEFNAKKIAQSWLETYGRLPAATASALEQNMVTVAQELLREGPNTKLIRVVFEKSAGPGGIGSFVEIEDSDGKSVNVGEFRDRPDGLCELVLPWDGEDWIKEAARATRVLLECSALADASVFINKKGVDRAHAIGLALKIESGETSGRKAHRHLGWLQCVAVAYLPSVSLDDMKEMNKAASLQIEKMSKRAALKLTRYYFGGADRGTLMFEDINAGKTYSLDEVNELLERGSQ